MDDENEFIRWARNREMPEWWIVDAIISNRIGLAGGSDAERAKQYRLTECQAISGMSYEDWDKQIEMHRPLPFRIPIADGLGIPLDASVDELTPPPPPPPTEPIDWELWDRMNAEMDDDELDDDEW
jgi:hypothetical protein